MSDILEVPVVRVAGDTSIVFNTKPWERWFAWHPVRLYMSSRHAWLRWIWRRCVDKNGLESCDYTDGPPP